MRLDPTLLMSAQEAVAATFADAGVKVAWDARVPWADIPNKVVHLRPIPDLLSDEAVEDVRGDCDHELAHIKFTDPAAFELTPRQLVKTIANSIEDGRVERLMSEEWFGCGENLERSADRAVARIVAAAKPGDELDRRARALCGLSMLAYGRTLEDVIGRLGDDIRSYYEPLMPIIHRLPSCSSTTEAINIGTALADQWQWRPTKVELNAKPKKGKSEDKAKPEPSNDEDAAADEIAEKTLSVASARKASVSALELTPINTYRAKTVNDRVEPIKAPSFDVHKLFGVFFDGIRKIVPNLRRRLLMEFRSAGKKGARHLKSGKLDERSLHRVILNDPRVYKADRRAILHKSTVTILVDCSASMTQLARPAAYPGEPTPFRSKLFIAAQAAAAVCTVLDLLRIPNECLAFTTMRAPVGADPNFERVRPVRHLTIKPFNKSTHACRANFVSLSLYEHCAENIDGEAILWAARRLLTQPKAVQNPVLIVFSDGAPASQPEDSEVLAKHLQDTIRQAERAGVAIFGVGIASDAVRRFYSNSVVVNNLNNLVADFYELLRKVLRERLALAAR